MIKSWITQRTWLIFSSARRHKIKLVDFRSKIKGFFFFLQHNWNVDFNSCHGILLMAKVFINSKNKKINSWKKRLLNTKITSLAQEVPESQVYYREILLHTLLVLILFDKNLVLVIPKYMYLGLDGPLQVQLFLCDIFWFTAPIAAT